MKKLIFLLLIFPFTFLNAQIKNGPMVGYSEMKEVLLWIQTERPAKVKFMYWEQGTTNKLSTDEVQTVKKDGFTAKIICDQVTMGKKYDYEVYLDGKKVTRDYPLSFQSQTLWQYRTDPPNFKVAMGSCNYVNEEATDRPGKPYGGFNEIFTSIYNKKPDLMIWGGDNLYYRETDQGTRTGLIHRNTHSRAIPEMQALLGSTHHYAIWDDHDYGPNDSDRGFVGKRDALDVFKLFWGNPNYAFDNEGVTGTFMWNDVQFFLMDDRFWRTPDENYVDKREFFGTKQMQWLIDNLITSKAPFKVIVCGGQVINPAKVFETMANYEEERTYLLKKITDAKIEGVIFVTGDRHHSCLQKLERPGTYPLYDLTVSPFTSGPASPVKEEAASPIVEGTLVKERNFCIAEFTGKRTDRSLKITIFDSKGEQKWTKEIKASELK
jgi:alkaline phosphatase D